MERSIWFGDWERASRKRRVWSDDPDVYSCRPNDIINYNGSRYGIFEIGPPINGNVSPGWMNRVFCLIRSVVVSGYAVFQANGCSKRMQARNLSELCSSVARYLRKPTVDLMSTCHADCVERWANTL